MLKTMENGFKVLLPRQDVSPDGAANRVEGTELARICSISPIPSKFQAFITNLARFRGEPRKNDIFAEIPCLVLNGTKTPALSAPTLNRDLIMDNLGILSTARKGCLISTDCYQGKRGDL